MCGEATCQMAVLRALGARGCQTIDVLAEATGLTRRQVTTAAGRLILRGLAERIEAGCYRLTAEGEAAHAGGEVLTSGPVGPRRPRAPARSSMRVRLWRAARIKRRFTIGDVVRLAARGGERDPRGNATRYLALLARAGYLRRLPGRQKDGKPTSNGVLRYALVRDTGPAAPAVVADAAGHYIAMRDANDGKTYPLERPWLPTTADSAEGAAP